MKVLLFRRKSLALSIPVVTGAVSENGLVKCCAARCQTCMMTSNGAPLFHHGNQIKTARASCKSWNVIYAFQCKICNKLYVGKTSDCLSQRVNGHRSKFYHVLKNSDTITEDCDDEHIVGAHLVHGHNIERRKDFNLSYRLFVLAQVNPTMFDTTEQLWINKLKTLRPFGLNKISSVG